MLIESSRDCFLRGLKSFFVYTTYGKQAEGDTFLGLDGEYLLGNNAFLAFHLSVFNYSEVRPTRAAKYRVQTVIIRDWVLVNVKK